MIMRILFLPLFLLVTGCVTVDNIQDLLSRDELAKREFYKCSQGISIDIGSASNAGGSAVMGTGSTIAPFLTAPMLLSNMHYKKIAGAPVADITVDEAVRIAAVSSYFTFQGYCRALGCDQPGKMCLEIDARLFGYNGENEAAVEVTIVKTPAGPEFPRQFTSYRKVGLKGKDYELTVIPEAEALKIRDYYRDEYYKPAQGR